MTGPRLRLVGAPTSPRRSRRPFRAWWTHPLTSRQIIIRAATQRELDARLERLDRIREDLREGTITADEVERTLRRMTQGPITLERAAIAYARREGLAPETTRSVTSWLNGAARDLASRELDTLDASTCQQWIDRLRGAGMATSTIGRVWRTLAAIASYATVRGWIGGAPPWGMWRPKLRGKRGVRDREAARSPEELAELLAAARELDALEVGRFALGNLEARIAAVALLGLRQGELAGLRWRDVDFAGLTVTIARQWDGRALPKGRRVCTLRAIPELFALLEGVRARLRRIGLVSAEGDGPVFPDPRAAARGSRAHTAAGASPAPLPMDELRAAVRRARLPRPERWTATSLRDTFATLEAAAYGSDLAGLSERTRHASMSSLVKYLQSRSRAPAAPGFALPPAPPPPPALPSASSSTTTSRSAQRKR